jgi:hypothetical protein
VTLFALAACAIITSEEFDARLDYDGDGYVAAQFGGDDCADNDAAIHPDADELCNGIDDNCDGQIDEDSAIDAPSWYADPDGDGYGSTEVHACARPEGYAAQGGDCDDGDAGIHPGAAETWYDGVDQDCAGDSDYDQDHDGFDSLDYGGMDCDDTDPAINPDADEIWYDGVDQDCDSLSDYDQDQDGFDSADYGGDDCNDLDATVYPGADDAWYDGIDANCDGLSDFDQDGDGYDDPIDGGPDCDDQDATAHPGADEYCDGIDHDCDGLAYEDDSLDAPSWYTDSDGDGYGDAATAHPACTQPAGSVADATDCDDSDPSVTHRIWYVDADGDGYGDATLSVDQCDQPAGYVANDDDCNDADAAISPAATEVCDAYNVDENCNGLADDDDPGATGFFTYYADTDGDRYGDAANTIEVCDRPSGYVTNNSDCDDTDADMNPGADEVCDPLDVDENCNGLADENDPTCTDTTDYYVDADGDGYGAGGSTAVPLCDATAGYATNDVDCDDTDASVSPATGDCSIDLGTADVILEGESKYGDAGSSVALGDLDGDGADDVLVGADRYSEVGTYYGAGYVVLDPSVGSITLDAADATYRNTGSVSSFFGFSAAVGDLDGDGVGDALFGSANGGVLVELGPPSGDFSSADAVWTDSGIGYSLAAYDLDDDGADDAALGAASTSYGLVCLVSAFSGGWTSWTAVTSNYIQGEAYSDYFGSSVAMGDIDADGLGDLVVGAVYESTTTYDRGAVYVFDGPLSSGAVSASSANLKITGSDRYDYVGYSVLVEDLDGDGSDDVVVGAYDAVYVVLSSPTGTMEVADAEASFESSASVLNPSLAAGDLDGDAVADLVIGSYALGHAYVFFGAPSGSVTTTGADVTFDGESSGDYAGRSVATGDVDADGLDDIIIGAPYNDNAGTDAGAAYIVYGSGL